MALLSPIWLENDTYSAEQDRQLLDSLVGAPGIIGLGDLAVSQHAAGANMSVDIAVGSCVVTGSDLAGQGKYLCKSTAIANVTIATAPATGHSRIDLIVAQVRDGDANGGTNNDWILAAVTGTSATTGSQVAPAAPASSLVLAQIAVGPSVTTIVTGNITDKRITAAPGVYPPFQYFYGGSPSALSSIAPSTSVSFNSGVNLVIARTSLVRLRIECIALWGAGDPTNAGSIAPLLGGSAPPGAMSSGAQLESALAPIVPIMVTGIYPATAPGTYSLGGQFFAGNGPSHVAFESVYIEAMVVG